MIVNRTRTSLLAVALVLAGCGAADAKGQATSVTQPGSIEAIAFGSPEALVENLIAAIENGDAVTLQAVLPADSWDLFADVLLDGFMPSPGDPPCQEVTGNTARCYIFESGFPRVFEIEAESGAGGWVVTRAVIESTN